jgi:hypothetical protein
MKATSLRIGVVLGALGVAACSAPPADEAVDEESQDLTSTHVFHCRAAYRPSGPDIASIRLTKTHATLTAVGPSLVGVDAVYTYNPNYQPRAASHQGDSQYAWTDATSHKMVLLFDGTMRAGGAALPGGGHGGDVTLEGPHISHGIESMLCRR